MSEPPPDADLNAVITDGRRKLRAKDLDGAAADFAKATEINSASVEAHELAARCAFLRKDFEAAAKHFKRASKCDTRRVEPLVNLGAVLNVLKDHKEAVKVLQGAVSKRAGRSNAEAYYNLGIAYRGAGQATMAVQAYREAIRLNSDFAEAHQNLGNAYLDLNNLRQARVCFSRALELKPTLGGAKKGLAKVDAAATAGRDPALSYGKKQSAVAEGFELSETARINDRAVLRDLTEKFERSVKAWAAELTVSIEPGIRQTVKGISGAVDATAVRRAMNSVTDGVQSCEEIKAVLNETTAEYREHENAVRETATGA